jgi:hypothetical protein
MVCKDITTKMAEEFMVEIRMVDLERREGMESISFEEERKRSYESCNFNR